MKAKGTLQTRFYTIIPLLFFFSKSRITNGNIVAEADKEPTTGLVYAVHITPFFAMSLVIPTFLKKLMNQKIAQVQAVKQVDLKFA